MQNRSGSSLNLDTTVVGLQGHPISSEDPEAGEALVFDGTEWVPTTVQTGGGGAAVGPTPPSSPTIGDLWFDDSTGTLNVWDGSNWVPAYVDNDPFMPLSGGTFTGPVELSGDATTSLEPVTLQQMEAAIAAIPPPSGGGGASLDDTPPSDPEDGDLWWNLDDAKLYIWDGSQWVITVNTPEGGGEMTGPIPFSFIFPGAQWPQMQVNVPIVVAVTIPEDLVGSVYYNGENATATTNTFVLNQISGGATAQIGLVTVGTDGTAIFTGVGADLEPGDILQMIYPSTTGDPTLGDVGITILSQRG